MEKNKRDPKRFDTELFGWVNTNKEDDYSSETWAYIMLNKEYIKGTVMDIGCAVGLHVIPLATIFEDLDLVYGIDINQEAIDCSNSRLPEELKDKVKYYKVNVLDLENYQEESSIDTMVSFHTMEHFPEVDLEDIFSQIKRALKNNGHIIIIIPYEHAHNDGNHKTFWNETSLSEFMEKNGFETIKCNKIQNNNLAGIFKNNKETI